MEKLTETLARIDREMVKEQAIVNDYLKGLRDSQSPSTLKEAADALARADKLHAKKLAVRKLSEVLEAAEALAEVGLFVKVISKEHVEDVLDQFDAPLVDTEAIVNHVVQGDDWKPDVLKVNDDDRVRIWGIVMGTAHDHPEWFGEEALKQL